MSQLKRYAILFLTTSLFLAGFTSVDAQQDTLGASSEIDTSQYMPPLYEGAINYDLMVASSNGYTSEIKRLIDRGADINTESIDGVTPLIYAVLNNKPEAVKMILNYKPVIDKLTSSYETALLIAVKSDYFDICEALIRAGADVDYPDRNGATPLHYASINGYFEIADLLLYYEAAVDEKSDDGITPLMAAIMAGYANIADLLIQNGANMEARNREGNTPFLIATVNGDTLIMDLLRKNGVDIYTVNNARYSALDLSISADQPTATRYLLDHGNKWAEAPEKPVDPYKVAAKYRRREMVDLLKQYDVPGQVKYAIDQATFTLSSRFVLHDYYTGLSVSLKEPYLNAGITLGCDLKLWYTRVLVKDSEFLYHQYFNKAYLIYGGVFKDFLLYEQPFKSQLLLSANLNAGYSFGQTLRGTEKVPPNQFLLIPGVSLRYKLRNVSFSLGAEYIKSDFYHIGPVWLRAGISYTRYFDKVRTQIKPLKWY
jgi:ankyrin repeat protein